MIVIALRQDGTAEVVSPSRLFQGSDSEKIFVLSPYPATCPVQITSVTRKGINTTGNGSHVPMRLVNNSPYNVMTPVELPEDFAAVSVSLWEYDPPVAWTAEWGVLGISMLVQKPNYSETDRKAGAPYAYKNLTTYTCNVTVEQTVVPAIPTVDDVDAYAELLSIVNEYALRISSIENTLSSADNAPTEGSENLVKSGGTWQAIEDAKDAAVDAAKDYTNEKIREITGETVVNGISFDGGETYEHGDVEVNKDKIGLGNVDNTSDENKPVSTLQRQAIDAAEQAAKDYAKTLSFEGQGTKVYENGSPSARIDIPKVYNSISDIDASFNENTTPRSLISAMESNSVVACPGAFGSPIGCVQPTYKYILPNGAEGINGVLRIEKRTRDRVVCASGTYEENCGSYWGGNSASSSFSSRNMAAVYKGYIYTVKHDGYYGLIKRIKTNNQTMEFDEHGYPVLETISIPNMGIAYRTIFGVEYGSGNNGVYFVGKNGSSLSVAKYTGHATQWQNTYPDTISNDADIFVAYGQRKNYIGANIYVSYPDSGNSVIVAIDMGTGAALSRATISERVTSISAKSADGDESVYALGVSGTIYKYDAFSETLTTFYSIQNIEGNAKLSNAISLGFYNGSKLYSTDGVSQTELCDVSTICPNGATNISIIDVIGDLLTYKYTDENENDVYMFARFFYGVLSNYYISSQHTPPLSPQPSYLASGDDQIVYWQNDSYIFGFSPRQWYGVYIDGSLVWKEVNNKPMAPARYQHTIKIVADIDGNGNDSVIYLNIVDKNSANKTFYDVWMSLVASTSSSVLANARGLINTTSSVGSIYDAESNTGGTTSITIYYFDGSAGSNVSVDSSMISEMTDTIIPLDAEMEV